MATPTEGGEDGGELFRAATGQNLVPAHEFVRGYTTEDLRVAWGVPDDNTSWRPPQRLSAAQVRALESHRMRSITELVRSAGVDADEALQLSQLRLDEARARVLNRMSTSLPRVAAGGATVVAEERTKKRTAIHNALLHRAGILPDADLGDARTFRAFPMLRIAEECGTMAGQRFDQSDPDQVLRAALHGSSDFPGITADVANKSLLRGLQLVPRNWEPLATRNDPRDFKEMHSVDAGQVPRPKELPPEAEIKYGTVGERAEKWRLLTYASGFALSRHAMINDDAGAFTTLPMRWGGQWEELLKDLVWGMLIANPTMGDGTAMFASARGNLGDLTLTEEGLSAAREAMRLRVDPTDGKTLLNVMATTIVLPPRLETEFDKLHAAILPNQASNVSVFSGKFGTVIVEPRLQAAGVTNGTTAYYLFGSAALHDILQWGYLAGSPGPKVESQVSWEKLGMEFRCYGDFGVGAVGHVAAYKSTGTTTPS